jgi:hypothetical protein
MRRTYLSLMLVLASLSGVAQNSTQQKTDLPKVFDTARYVYVEAESGDPSSHDLTTEDRQAIYNVEKQLKAWGRYTLTLSREHADLVLRVHKSHAGNSNIPVVVPSGPRLPGRAPRDPSDPSNSPGGSPGLGTEISSPDDELSVYIPAGSASSMTGPIWNDSRRNGLNAPRLPLFQELKQDVEDAYPR